MQVETAPAPGSAGTAPFTLMRGLPHSEQAPKRAVVDLAIAALGDVPGLVRIQSGDGLLGKVREALGGEKRPGGEGR